MLSTMTAICKRVRPRRGSFRVLASFLLSLLINDLNLIILLGSMMLLASFTILCSLMIVSLTAALLFAARCGAIVCQDGPLARDQAMVAGHGLGIPVKARQLRCK